MTKGLAYLNAKSWHVTTKENQRKLFIAEEKERMRLKKQKEAEAEMARRQALFATDMTKEERMRMPVDFMYTAPPGYSDLAKKDDPVCLPRVPQPDRMEEKFDFLKNAPREGDYARDLSVHFRPFGIEIRNVQCKRCGKWGHQTGDRECPLRDINPNDEKRQKTEDPLAQMQQFDRTATQVDNMVVKSIDFEPNPDDLAHQLLPEERPQFQSEAAAALAAAGAQVSNTNPLATSTSTTTTRSTDDAPEQILSTMTDKDKLKLLRKLGLLKKKSHKHKHSNSKKHHHTHSRHTHTHRHKRNSDSDSDSEASDPHSRGRHHKSARSRSRSNSRTPSPSHRRDDGHGGRHMVMERREGRGEASSTRRHDDHRGDRAPRDRDRDPRSSRRYEEERGRETTSLRREERRRPRSPSPDRRHGHRHTRRRSRSP